ncbi:hypothetical protein [Pinibacter aurantiacus]|uniref:HEAT repeat domain-containing protein n=1 Tax=Pinibacter aurantiacus TaxID=2851599 RepID=A0A9E2W7Z6_9BACT|nr:hypothetical protein [Pinibacter aurantiacus]MBV4357197.1 hypothetical protein [Pinibacter aurantiacus]
MRYYLILLSGILLSTNNSYAQKSGDSLDSNLSIIIDRMVKTGEKPYSIIQTLKVEDRPDLLVPLLSKYDTINNSIVQQKVFECYHDYGIKSPDIKFRQKMVLKLLSGCSDTVDKSYACGTNLNYLKKFATADFNEKSKSIIRGKIIASKKYIGDFSLIAGMLSLNDMMSIVEELSMKNDKDVQFKLALARMGNDKALNELYYFFKSLSINERLMNYEEDLMYVKQPKILQLIIEDLYSEEYYSVLEEGAKNPIIYKYNQYALFILSKVIEGFPLKANYAKSYTNKEVEIARMWIKQNGKYKIIKNVF